MTRSHIVEHLKAAHAMADAEGKYFLAYMIEMAIAAAKSSNKASDVQRQLAS